MDNALQKHWRSCSSAQDRSSVNDDVLNMSAIQDSVLSLNFTQSLPKTVADKVLAQIAKDEKGKDDKNQGQGG